MDVRSLSTAVTLAAHPPIPVFVGTVGKWSMSIIVMIHSDFGLFVSGNYLCVFDFFDYY